MSRETFRASLGGVFFGILLGALIAGAIAADKWGQIPIEGTPAGLIAPSELWYTVTPSNSVAIASGTSRAIYSHDGGNVVCVDRGGTALVFLFAAGEIKPLRCVRVNSTSTTSATIYALY